MKLIDYLQSIEGIRMTAFVATSIIFIAIILRFDPLKRTKPTKDDVWTAEGFYNYLLAVVNASRDMDELQAAWFMVENTWFTKTFRVRVSGFERNRKYAMLCEAYAKKETELTQIPIVLCKN